MATGDVWRLSSQGDISNAGLFIVTNHVRFKSPGATFAGAAALFKVNLLDLLKTYQHTSWNWRQINGNTVNVTPPQAQIYTTGFPSAGTQPGDLLPWQCACCVKLATVYAGRSYRGRNFIPGLPESQAQAGSTWTTAMINAFQTYYEDFLANIGGAGSNPDYEWVVWSRKLLTYTPILSAAVRGIVRNQRRRMPDYGV